MSAAADVLAAALRARILDGALPGGARLREQALADEHDAARHTVRAALRMVAAEGLVVLVPNAGARVALLTPADVADLATTRRVLEVGAARLALERGDGRLPEELHAAARDFAALCRERPAWRAVVVAHAGLHEALVAAADSPRLVRAHASLSAELALFLVQGRPHHDLEALAADHAALPGRLEREGVAVLEAHLDASEAALLAGAQPQSAGRGGAASPRASAQACHSPSVG